MDTPFDPQPAPLVGRCVRLEPLASAHAADLFRAARNEDIWRYLPRPMPRRLEEMQALIAEALDDAAGGASIPFATIHLATGRAVGSTRYLEIRRPHRALEIGWTWLAADQQRTATNTECKLLLLTRAFEDWGAVRVQFKTDRRNEPSQKAIERLGAVREGVLRQHMTMPDGHLRDSVYYGILNSEWPAAKARLQARLAAAR